MILPVNELCDLCNRRGIAVVIDGAHALGQVEIDLKRMNPGFYTSNAHKWLCAPKGSAFLYVSKKYQPMARPLVISHGYGRGFLSEYYWSGTNDYSALLCVEDSLLFREKLVENPDNESLSSSPGATSRNTRIVQYNNDLCHWAAKMLAERWGTRILLSDPRMYASMAVIQLPFQDPSRDMDYNDADKIRVTLFEKHCIENMLVVLDDKKIWIRISAQVYNEKSDFEFLAEKVSEVMKGFSSQ